MADEKQPSKFQKLIQTHGEKLALGGAAVALLGYLVWSFALAAPDPSAGTLDNLATQISGQTKARHEGLAPKADYAKLSAPALDVYNRQIDVKEPPAWGGTVATKVDVKVTTSITTKEAPHVLAAITISSVDAALEGITVTFAKGEVPDGYEESPVSGFVIERRKGKGSWEVLDDDVAASATSYVDTKIEPKTEYTYRVRATTSDAKVTNATSGRGSPSNEVATKSLGIWKFSVLNPIPGDDIMEKKGSAYIIIEKFDKEHGKVDIRHIHAEGDKIGFWDNSFKHRIAVKGGSQIEVDFETGATLKTIRAKEIVHKYKQCNPKFEGGARSGCDIVTKEIKQTLNEIVIIDDEGGKILVYHPEKRTYADQLCPEHAGK